MAASSKGRRRCEWCRHLLRRSARVDARYCGDRCRAAANRSLAREVAAYTAMLEFQETFRRGPEAVPRCPACGAVGGPFPIGHPENPDYQYRKDRRYCGGACRTRAWRARTRGVKPDGEPSR